jgi:hypothetical protein
LHAVVTVVAEAVESFVETDVLETWVGTIVEDDLSD